jgi:hypothetical protein
MTTHSPGIHRIALEHFKGRYDHARQQAAALGDSWPGDPANENLRLWLAIALAAGVGRDLPAAVCAAIEKEAIFPVKRRFLPRPSEIAHDHAWKGELARARNVARAKAEGSTDHRLIQRAIDLTVLAEALGAPPVETPASFEGRAAA